MAGTVLAEPATQSSTVFRSWVGLLSFLRFPDRNHFYFYPTSMDTISSLIFIHFTAVIVHAPILVNTAFSASG